MVKELAKKPLKVFKFLKVLKYKKMKPGLGPTNKISQI
jgi:hypothetical protein